MKGSSKQSRSVWSACNSQTVMRNTRPTQNITAKSICSLPEPASTMLGRIAFWCWSLLGILLATPLASTRLLAKADRSPPVLSLSFQQKFVLRQFLERPTGCSPGLRWTLITLERSWVVEFLGASDDYPVVQWTILLSKQPARRFIGVNIISVTKSSYRLLEIPNCLSCEFFLLCRLGELV